MKTMLVVFSDIKGVIHKEFVILEQTFDAAFYLKDLEKLGKLFFAHAT